ncbi:hypothetical protein QJS66_17475 [Kocuria rhizophila]|nr:hypothetical protein QJS66_17475 [Kocuria rhizophila]
MTSPRAQRPGRGRPPGRAAGAGGRLGGHYATEVGTVGGFSACHRAAQGHAVAAAGVMIARGDLAVELGLAHGGGPAGDPVAVRGHA